MQDLIQSMTFSMEFRGFPKSTQRTYLAHMKRFYLFCGQAPASVGYDEVRAFLHHAIVTRKRSSSYVNSAYGAIKFYYQSVLFREWNMLHIPRVKKKSFLPTILTFQEVCQILDATRNLKHRAILTTVYSAGLRVSEVAHLQITDIHSADMRLLVRQAKGGKDRYSILSNHNLLLLRQYWLAGWPTALIFGSFRASQILSPFQCEPFSLFLKIHFMLPGSLRMFRCTPCVTASQHTY